MMHYSNQSDFEIKYIDSNGNTQPLSVLFQEYKSFDKIEKIISQIGGFNSPLLFTKACGYFIPSLWKIVSNPLKEDNQNKYKIMRNWFATQGFTDILYIHYQEQHYIKIDANQLTEIPTSCRRSYYVKNPDLNIQTTGKKYQKDLGSLFIPATRKITDLGANKRYSYTEEGKTRKRVTAQKIIKEKIKNQFLNKFKNMKKGQILYIPLYDEDLVSTYLRLAFYEDRARLTNPVPGGVDLDALFSQHHERWLAVRNPFKPRDEFTFLVMFCHQDRVLKKTIKNLLLRETDYKNCTAADINHQRRSAELSTAKILVGRPKWSYYAAIESGAFQGWLDRGHALPQSLDELMVERGNGPLNYFLNGLIGDRSFRHAMNEENIPMSTAGSRIPVIYTGSFTQFPKNKPGISTIFMPDAATNQISGLGSTEFWLYKHINNKWHINHIIDLLKQQNSGEQPYSTFQVNVYTKSLLGSIKTLKAKNFKKIERLMNNCHADGIIVIVVPGHLTARYPRFGEIFNAARLLYAKKYKCGILVPHPKQILNDIIEKVKKYQPFDVVWTNLKENIVEMIKLFNFKANNEYQFVLEAFWNYAKKIQI